MKLWIAMSGGVDSSAAALLMKERFPGPEHSPEGVMLRLAEGHEADEADGAAVAKALGLPFTVLDRQEEFKRTVLSDFQAVYEACGTPNPCVICNRDIKFGALLAAARAAGAEKLVTGHYARLDYEEASGRYRLKKAADTARDQSYMLWTLSQEQLSHVLLPLGDYTKEEIRLLAAGAGLSTAHKRDSQDLCFVPDGDYAGFLERLRGRADEEGEFISPRGEVLGTHRGLLHYTLGQRRGLGIASEAPLFVTGLNPRTRAITLSHGEGLFSRRVFAGGVNWVSIAPPREPLRVFCKLRYRHREAPALLVPTEDGVTLLFDEPQRAVTPGQSAVFYDGELLLGGGFIRGSEEA